MEIPCVLWATWSFFQIFSERGWGLSEDSGNCCRTPEGMCYGIKPILRVDEQESLLVMLARCNIKQAYLATNQRWGDRLACSAQVSIKRSIAQHKDLKRAAPPQGSNCPYPPYPTYLSIYQSTNLSIYLSIYLPIYSIYLYPLWSIIHLLYPFTFNSPPCREIHLK